jgi:hypothetical protein
MAVFCRIPHILSVFSVSQLTIRDAIASMEYSIAGIVGIPGSCNDNPGGSPLRGDLIIPKH